LFTKDKNDKLKDINYKTDEVIEEYNTHKEIYNIKSEKISVIFILFQTQTENLTLRNRLSPIITKFDKKGSIYSALIVGNTFLYWDESGLCIPKTCFGNVFNIICDIKYQKDLPDIEAAKEGYFTRLSKKICEWNTKKVYDKNNLNCQHFVDCILEEFGVDVFEELPKDRPFYLTLEKLRKNGCLDEMTIDLNESK
jgi:hypothetical protein